MTPVDPTADIPREPAANTSRFHLKIADTATAWTVTGFATEGVALSSAYTVRIDVTAKRLDPVKLIGKTAVLRMDSGADSVLHGWIAHAAQTGESAQGRRYRIDLDSPLSRLKKFAFNRVFRKKTVPDIITDVLTGDGIDAGDIRISAAGNTPVLRYEVQYKQSDFDFITRLAARTGFTFWFEPEQTRAVICFSDKPPSLPAIAAPLAYQPLAGDVRTTPAVVTARRRGRLCPAELTVRNHSRKNPETDIAATAHSSRALPAWGHIDRFGDPVINYDQALAEAVRRMQVIDWQRAPLFLSTDIFGLTPGRIVTLTGVPGRSEAGEYRVVQVDHTGNQQAGLSFGDRAKGMTYANRVLVIPKEVPFMPVERPVAPCGTITGVIESPSNTYAHLDEQGRYRTRLWFDRSNRPPAESSRPVPKLQPLTGVNEGFHFPLHAGAEVAVACLNGDVNQPVILGALPNPANFSPVTSRNRSENIIRTWGGNELVLDDKKGKQRIELFTRDRRNRLLLFADEQHGHRVELVSEEGDMELIAGAPMGFVSGADQTITAGQNHRIDVKANARLNTRKDTLALDAGRHIVQSADRHTDIEAERGNLTMTSKGHTALQSGKAATLRSRTGPVTVNAGGSFSLKGAKAIAISGEGAGHIRMAGGSSEIKIAAGGALTINSTVVDIIGNSIMKGGSSNFIGGAGGGAPAAGPSMLPVMPWNGDASGSVSTTTTDSSRPASPDKGTTTPDAKQAPLQSPDPQSKPPQETAPPSQSAGAGTPEKEKPLSEEEIDLVDLVYVPELDVILGLTPEEQQMFIEEEGLFQAEIEQLVQEREKGDRKRIEQAQLALAKKLDAYNVRVSTTGQGLTEIIRLKGHKHYTYVRPEKVKNHWRSYAMTAKDRDRSVANKIKTDGRFDFKKIQKEIAKKESAKVRWRWKFDNDDTLVKWANSAFGSVDWKLGGKEREADGERMFDVSAEAQWMRFLGGASVTADFKPRQGKFFVSAEGSSEFALGAAQAKAVGYIPDANGYEAVFETQSATGNKKYNLGYFQLSYEVILFGFAGVSAMGCAKINFDLKNGVPVLCGKTKDGTKKKSPDDEGFNAMARVFAGVEAGCDVKGKLNWKNPEKNESWCTLAEAGYGVSVAAGAGAELNFSIYFNGTKFSIRWNAGVVFGLGFAGKMAAVVDAGSIVDLIQFVYTELRKNDFSFLDFIDQDAFDSLSAMVCWTMINPNPLSYAYSSSIVKSVYTWWKNRSDYKREAEQMAKSILADPEGILKFSTPETQGRMLCILCRRFVESAEKKQELAILKILQNIQSKREYYEVCEHMDLSGKKVSAERGDDLIQKILDGTQQDIFNNWKRNLPNVAKPNGPVLIVTNSPFPSRKMLA